MRKSNVFNNDNSHISSMKVSFCLFLIIPHFHFPPFPACNSKSSPSDLEMDTWKRQVKQPTAFSGKFHEILLSSILLSKAEIKARLKSRGWFKSGICWILTKFSQKQKRKSHKTEIFLPQKHVQNKSEFSHPGCTRLSLGRLLVSWGYATEPACHGCWCILTWRCYKSSEHAHLFMWRCAHTK